MKTIITILNELEETQGSLAKLEILEVNSKNDLLRSVFVAALDPYITYYVSKFKCPPPSRMPLLDDEAIQLFLNDILEPFSTRVITGNAAKDLLVKFFGALSPDQQKWCQRILLRRLRIGVQESTVNKVWPNLVTSFSVALAATLKSSFVKGEGIKILESVNYPIRCEPKLDGLRLIAIKNNGKVTLYTRNGTIIDTLPTIVLALENCQYYDNVVLDGEALSSSGTWNDSVSVMMSKKSKKDDSDIVFNVFDSIAFESWKNKTGDVHYQFRADRVERIVEQINNKCVKVVPHIIANNESELKLYFQKCMDEGFEGIMLKKTNTPYEFKRSENILKLKPQVTYEGVVVGWFEGRNGTRLAGGFGGFHLLMPNGVVTRVGSGFNDQLRSTIQIENPDSYLLKIVEIEAQPDPLTNDGLSVDGRARFPVFCRFRDEADVDKSMILMGKDYIALGK